MKRFTLIVIVVLKCSKLCSTSVDLLCQNAVMTLKSIFLIISEQSQFLHIKSTRLVCYLLHFSLNITIK